MHAALLAYMPYLFCRPPIHRKTEAAKRPEWLKGCTDGQRAAYEDRKEFNTSVSGSAGTGKRYIMKLVVEELRARHGDAVAACGYEAATEFQVYAHTLNATLAELHLTLRCKWDESIRKSVRESVVRMCQQAVPSENLDFIGRALGAFSSRFTPHSSRMSFP